MQTSNLIVVKEFNGKHRINDAYRPIAEALKAKYRELEHIPVKHILFIENTEDKRKKNKATVFAQIGKVPDRWGDIIYQTTGKHFSYVMEIFRNNITEMSREQIIALIYHELRHIGYDGDLISHDIEDWANMVEKLGVNWAGTKAYIPDLLDKDIDWESIEGPETLFPAENTLRVVK